MLDTLRHYGSVLACCSRLAVQRQFEYPLFLVSWLIMIPLYYFSSVWMLKILVHTFHPLAGWDFPQLVFLYGLGLVSHGLQVTLFIPAWNIEFYVNQAEFDRLLVRPMNVFFQFLTRDINLIGCVDLIPAVSFFVYGCYLVHFRWTPGNTVAIIAVILGAVLIRAGIYTALGSVAFWTQRSYALTWTMININERGTLYPLAIYPHWFQLVLTFLIPIGFVSFYPACQFLGRDDGMVIPLGLAIWTPLVGLTVMAIGLAIFTLGLRRYESAGS